MSLSIPITLAHHVFPQVSIITNPSYQATGEPATTPTIESRLTVGEIDGGTNQFVIELYVKVDAGDNPRIPYSVEIACAAQAVIAGDMPKGEHPNHAIAEIGHRLMFPAVRELILSLTARQPWGQFSIGLGVLGKPVNPDADSGKKAVTAKHGSRPVRARKPAAVPPPGKDKVATAPVPAIRPTPRRIATRKKIPE